MLTDLPVYDLNVCPGVAAAQRGSIGVFPVTKRRSSSWRIEDWRPELVGGPEYTTGSGASNEK